MDPKRSIRVLLSALDSPATLSGGVEWYVYHLALALQDLGHEVRVMARHPPAGSHAPPGVHYEWVNLPALRASHRTRLALEPFFARAVRKAARWADVVHGQNADGRGAVGVRPVVATVHTTPLDEWESSRLGGWREALYQRRIQDLLVNRWRRFLAHAAHVWTPSEHVGVSLRALGVVNPELLPNPVEPVPYSPMAEARAKLGLPAGPIVLFIARLARVKRADRLIAAMRDLPGVTAVIAGDGPEEESLREQGRRVDGGRIRFMGRVDATTRALLLRAADVYCLPSENEGQPLMLLEAMSVGLPCVATRAEWVPPALASYGLWGDDLPALLREALQRGRGPEAPVMSYARLARRISAVYESIGRTAHSAGTSSEGARRHGA